MADIPTESPRRDPHAGYPMCSGCGHHASGIIAGQCTSFVPYPDGDPRGLAGYCLHRCVDDPAIIAWLGGRRWTLTGDGSD